MNKQELKDLKIDQKYMDQAYIMILIWTIMIEWWLFLLMLWAYWRWNWLLMWLIFWVMVAFAILIINEIKE